MKQIAVLMTVHNRRDKTEECLGRVLSNALPDDYKISLYLTDDGCTDGTSEMLKKEFPMVHVIQGDGNLFWNRGMWTAWEEASKGDYDFYLWLNDDTMLKDDAIMEVLEESNEAGNKAIITGATCSVTKKECTYGLYAKEKILVPNGEFQTGDGMNGNFVLIPKYVYKILGNLDPYYTHAGGDTDYGLRAIKAGIPVYLSKVYVGTCESHPTIDKWCNPQVPFRERWNYLNRPNGMPLHVMFYHDKKHFNMIKACFHVVTTVLHCCFPSIWLKYKL